MERTTGSRAIKVATFASEAFVPSAFLDTAPKEEMAVPFGR